MAVNGSAPTLLAPMEMPHSASCYAARQAGEAKKVLRGKKRHRNQYKVPISTCAQLFHSSTGFEVPYGEGRFASHRLQQRPGKSYLTN